MGWLAVIGIILLLLLSNHCEGINCGCRIMALPQLPKLEMTVRFRSPAPIRKKLMPITRGLELFAKMIRFHPFPPLSGALAYRH